MPQTPHLPPELLEHIIHFSIRAGSLKEALRLRLVSRDFKTLVEQNMFRTRFLDDSVRALRAQGPAFGEPDLGFLKRYLAFCVNAGHEVVCPGHLINRAADWLTRPPNDDSQETRRRHVDALCQVGFWEMCCEERIVGDKCVDENGNRVMTDAEMALCHVLMEMAFFTGDWEAVRGL